MVFCMQLSVFAASDAKTEAVYGTPVIDGIIDDVWATANEEKIALVDKSFNALAPKIDVTIKPSNT